MIKFLECPDLHYSPKYGETIEKLGDKIAEAATENEIDFIALPGDLYDAPIMATDKGGINQLRNIVQKWLKICPVVAIEGTPSHDGPGCYGPLEDMGLRLLNPGKVYGYKKGRFVKGQERFNVFEITTDGIDFDCILFGIPELNKKNIQSRLNLSAEQANAEAVTLFNRYITEFVAPVRLKYANIPAVALFHGNVSDSMKSNENDVILKASDIVLHTVPMAIANIDRWSLAHIHKPWESKVICAGYAGSWGKNWTEIGFKPGMNLVEINMVSNGSSLSLPNITRIPYGTPERKKIIHPLNKYDPDIAYLLETQSENLVFPPDAVHPLSEIRIKPKQKESRRVDPDELEKIKSLRDLYKLFEPASTEPILKKIDEIEATIKKQTVKPIDVQIESIEIIGAGAFFNDDNIKIDLSEIDGITELHGDGNGVGKSALLSFCSPYPVVIGKDTKSGRASAIKDFFDKPESKIIKKLKFNNKSHEHLITIKAAHTQTPKVECFLTIDGNPQLDRGTFDEMMTECENIYGPFNDYLLTSFYIQPLQGTAGSSLMSAKMVDIRNLVQAIAGIDREKESRFSLDKVKSLEKTIADLTAYLSGAYEFNADIPALEKEREELNLESETLKLMLSEKLEAGKKKKAELEQSQKLKTDSDAEKLKKKNNDDRIRTIDSDIISANKAIISFQLIADKLTDNKKLIADNDIVVKYYQEYQRLLSEYENIKSTLETDLKNLTSARATAIKSINADIIMNKKSIESLESNIKVLDKPCVNCGYIDKDSEIKIDESKGKIATLEGTFEGLENQLYSLEDKPEIVMIQRQLDDLKPPIEYDKIPMEENRVNIINAEIQTGIEAAASIKATEENIIKLSAEKKQLESVEYDINETIDSEVLALESEIDNLRNIYTGHQKEAAAKESEIISIDKQIVKAQDQETAIAEKEKSKATDESNLTEWSAIAKNFQASKIPGFELDMFLTDIDIEASHIIEPYLNARFSFNTETQGTGKKSTVDRFDIRIHDSETGKEKSFIEFNPGTKAFLNDAYVKALVKQRNTRFQRNYSPIIIDEADEPIHPTMIECFYTIQSEYWKDNTVIIVSHNPASHEFIENTILIDDLKYHE